jgi:hypothetical protein
LIEDPHPDKGRALGRLEEKQGRQIRKDNPHANRVQPPAGAPPGEPPAAAE